MLKRSRIKSQTGVPSSKWRNFQDKLQRESEKRRTARRIPRYIFLLSALVLVCLFIFKILDYSLNEHEVSYSSIFSDQSEKFDSAALQRVIRRLPVASSTDNEFKIVTGNKQYHVQTSIDPTLQQYIIKNIDQKNSKYFGFVAMEPDTGRILSMVSYDKTGKNDNICTLSDFPAASLFKIITAAAVIEQRRYHLNTPVSFNGKKYSLYKSQLKEHKNKYTNILTFKKSFADSVNPVFGKIGVMELGKRKLESYADAFDFNKQFRYEIPLKTSKFVITDEPYNWAEIASGFNKETMISPLHAALIISTILNNGKTVTPTLIDKISGDDHIVYQRVPKGSKKIILPKTARILKELMNSTIISGTASKSYRGSYKDKVLSKLYIGGKTGSINNNKERLKFDWFAGFAEEKNGPKKIALSVLVVHKDFIGTRAASYSRMAIKEYIKNHTSNPKI